jgi:hypothetical protein
MRSARRFRHLVRHSLLALTTGAALVLSFAAAAQDNAGSVKELAGQAFAGTSAARRTLEPQAAILLGDRVETGEQSRVTMLLGHQTTVRLGERGRVVIDRFLVEAGGEITLQSGPVMVEHPDGGSAERLRIRTSYGLIAVRGTRVFAGFEGKALAVFVERGVVSVRAAGQTVLLRSGDGTSIPTPGARPTPVAQWKAKRIDALFGGIR